MLDEVWSSASFVLYVVSLGDLHASKNLMFNFAISIAFPKTRCSLTDRIILVNGPIESPSCASADIGGGHFRIALMYLR